MLTNDTQDSGVACPNTGDPGYAAWLSRLTQDELGNHVIEANRKRYWRKVLRAGRESCFGTRIG
jgi:hypothetical protein